MASDVKVKVNSAGARELLRSAAVAADIERRAKAITAQANGQAPEHGYTESEPFTVVSGVTDRAYSTVYTRTDLGKAMQAKHSTLTKALDAGRG